MDGFHRWMGRLGFASVMNPEEEFGHRGLVFYSYGARNRAPENEQPTTTEGGGGTGGGSIRPYSAGPGRTPITRGRKEPEKKPEEKKEPYSAKIDTPKEVKEKRKTPTSKEKKVKEMKEIPTEVKEYIDGAIKELEERQNRSVTEDLFNGVDRRAEIRNQGSKIDKLLEELGRAYQSDLTDTQRIYPLVDAKLKALRTKDDGPPVKELAESKTNAEAYLPTGKENLVDIDANLEGQEDNLFYLLNELTDLEKSINGQAKMHGKRAWKFEQYGRAFDKQRDLVNPEKADVLGLDPEKDADIYDVFNGNVPGVLGYGDMATKDIKLGKAYRNLQKRDKETIKDYAEFEVVDKEKKVVSGYVGKAMDKLSDVLDLRKSVQEKIRDIDSYFGNASK
jgi:hypothetical protein